MRIAAYCRVSTEKDEQLDSMQNQKDFFEDFAIRYNHKLVKIYADEGISGKQMENRTQFMRMLSDSKLHIFDMVVVKDISRFARNTVDFLTAVRELKNIGVEVQFLSNNQTILGNSEFILTIFSAMAQEESANLSKRVKFGKKVNAKKGRVPNIIYGYDKIDTFTLSVNENEANTVKRIFDMYSKSGLGSRKISDILNNENIQSKKGVCWTPKTITRIISNPIYIGILINNKTETKDFLTGKKHMLPKDENFIHIRPELKIISDEQYNTVQTQLLERQKIYKNNISIGKYSGKHTFSTLIKCAICDYSYIRKVYKYKNIYIRWRCSGNSLYTKDFCENNFVLDEDDLKNNITKYLISCIVNEEKFINNIKKDYKKNSYQGISHDTLYKQMDKLNRIKEKYKIMYTNDIITFEELKEKCHETDSHINDTNKKLCEFNNTTILNNFEMYDIEKLLSLNEFSNTEMRKLIDKITVNQNGEVYIIFKKF